MVCGSAVGDACGVAVVEWLAHEFTEWSSSSSSTVGDCGGEALSGACERITQVPALSSKRTVAAMSIS
jgi:hypothetical protein